MATFRSGKTGSVEVASTTLSLSNWRVAYTGANLETTNFESDGYYTGITGILKCAWDVKGDWDANQTPYTDPPGLFPRDDGTNMILTTSTLDGTSFSFDDWICDSSTVEVTTVGKVTFDASGTSNGEFGTP